MGLLGLTPILVLILQLYGTRGDLPTLPGNRLLTGAARNLPGSTRIDCGRDLIKADFHRKKTFKPSEVLVESNFKTYPFTSRGVVSGSVGKFSFAKVTHGLIRTRTAYVLQDDESGESAYWLPQGGVIDIPQAPTAADPKYVFTADFGGCSWTVTPMNNGMLRLRHVSGNHENNQFNNLNEQQKGGPTTYAMQYKDYAYTQQHGRLIERASAYAYMHFSSGRWTLHIQHQACAPVPGNVVYKNGQVEEIKMHYSNQNRYSVISGTDFWRIR